MFLFYLARSLIAIVVAFKDDTTTTIATMNDPQCRNCTR